MGLPAFPAVPDCDEGIMSEPWPIMTIARALGYDESEHPNWNTAILNEATQVWDALMNEGFVEDRVDIGAAGHCEALVLMFRHHP